MFCFTLRWRVNHSQHPRKSYLVRCSIQDHKTSPGSYGIGAVSPCLLSFPPQTLPLSRDGLNALSVHRACTCSSGSGSFAQGEDICILDSCKKCELGLFLD